MKTGLSLVEWATELQRREALKLDLVCDTREMNLEVAEIHGKPQIALNIDTQGLFSPSPIAHGQIGAHTQIPAKYYDRMLAEAPELLAENANHWLHNNPSRRMVRLMERGARAFLSDRYRRIDHEQVAGAVLPELLGANQEVRIVSADVTETKLYLKALFPRIEGEVRKGDVVQSGIVITNSEVGMGAFAVRPLVYRLVCTNGMVSEMGGIRKNHVGRKVESMEDYAIYTDETVAADDKALALKMRDAVRAAMAQASFDELLERMREAATGGEIRRPVKGVEILAKQIGLNQTEQEDVLGNLIRGGDFTRWGMLNAVTELANVHQSYDRASELEALGGAVLDLPPALWNRIAEAA